MPARQDAPNRNGLAGAALSVLLLAGLVFLTAGAGILLTRQTGRIAALWPANAVMLSLILRAGPGRWSALALAGLAGNLAANLLAGDSWQIALLLGLCNQVEVLLAFWGIGRRLGGGPIEPTNPRQIADFLLFAVLLGPVLSAALGATIMAALAGADPIAVGRMWFTADALGMLTVAPPVLALRLAAIQRLRRLGRLPEVAPILLGVAGAALLVFGQSRYPLLFLVFPALLLPAFRLGVFGAALASLISALIGIVLTAWGYGPLSLINGAELPERVLVLQGFLALATLTSLSLATIVSRHGAAVQALRDSEERFRLLVGSVVD